MTDITDDLIADPNAEPPVFPDEVEWTDEVDDDAEPESTGLNAHDEEEAAE